MSQSTEVKDLFAALSVAQGEMRGALKDADNPFFRSRYADLESVWEACRGPLSRNGLSVVQTTEFDPVAGICVVTTLGHSSGQWIRGTLPTMAVKQDPQGIGSSISYSRRYALAAIVGIYQTDDDGEAAMARDTSVTGKGRIAPEQPAPGDGIPSINYTIPFGKFGGRTLEEIDPKELESYIGYLESTADKKKVPITGAVKDFVDRATKHIIALETAPL